VRAPLLAKEEVADEPKDAVLPATKAAKRLDEVALVNCAVEAVVAPIGVLLMVPPEMVSASETRASDSVPFQAVVNVSVLPDPVTVSPRFVSVDVAIVIDGPVCPCPAGPIDCTALVMRPSDDVQRDEMIQKSGQMGVPVLDIGGTILVGFNKSEIERALV
jgi:glutaredoxin